MLTYPRFAKACYAFFAVAVLAAILKLSVSGAEPALLRMLPAAPIGYAAEPATKPPTSPEDRRLGGFSDDGEAERPEAVLSRPASLKQALETPSGEALGGASGSVPVFRRPSLNQESSSGPVCGDLGDAPRSSRVVFPLPEAYFDSYDDTWGAARPQGGHEGSDLMSPTGTPEFAVTDGKLVAVAASDENGWNKLGGYTVMLKAAYSIGPINKGDLFYYAHMDQESSLPVGTEVRAGQRIGTVGDTGEGPPDTRGKFPSHLHLGWYDADLSEERSEVESGAMNPYPLLRWLEGNGGAVSGGTDSSYCEAPQSPTPTPSTGQPDWPTPAASGQRPDLDTGSDAASPTPAVKDDGSRGEHPRKDSVKDQDNDETWRQDNDHAAEGKGESGEDENDEGKAARDEGHEDENHEGKAGDKGGEDEPEGSEEPQKDRKKAIELLLRKEVEAKMAALLRDLPSLDFDRATPNDADKRERDKERGSGPKHKAATERGEDRKEIQRPAEDRPERSQVAPPEDPPKPPALERPIPDPKPPALEKPIPEREPRPVPEVTGEEPKVVEKPEVVEPETITPPETERERPVREMAPLPDVPKVEPLVEDPTIEEVNAPVGAEAPLDAEEILMPTAEADKGE